MCAGQPLSRFSTVRAAAVLRASGLVQRGRCDRSFLMNAARERWDRQQHENFLMNPARERWDRQQHEKRWDYFKPTGFEILAMFFGIHMCLFCIHTGLALWFSDSDDAYDKSVQRIHAIARRLENALDLVNEDEMSSVVLRGFEYYVILSKYFFAYATLKYTPSDVGLDGTFDWRIRPEIFVSQGLMSLLSDDLIAAVIAPVIAHVATTGHAETAFVTELAAFITTCQWMNILRLVTRIEIPALFIDLQWRCCVAVLAAIARPIADAAKNVNHLHHRDAGDALAARAGFKLVDVPENLEALAAIDQAARTARKPPK